MNKENLNKEQNEFWEENLILIENILDLIE